MHMNQQWELANGVLIVKGHRWPKFYYCTFKILSAGDAPAASEELKAT